MRKCHYHNEAEYRDISQLIEALHRLHRVAMHMIYSVGWHYTVARNAENKKYRHSIINFFDDRNRLN